jgi:hypothetical protein
MQTTILGLLTLLHVIGGAAELGSYVIPSDLPDGHYASNGSIDAKTGFMTYTYLGPIDHDSLDADTDMTESAAGLERRATVNCNGRAAGDSVSAVVNGFANYWGGRDISSYGSVWTTGGSSRA